MISSLFSRIAFPVVDLFARQIDPKDSPYNYVPTQWVAILFTSLFGISTLTHVGQAFYYRMWWLFPTICLCGIMEITGWAARLWSSINPISSTPFTIQISATIMGPTPLVAANFIILGQIIQRLGPEYSRLSPRLYSIIFCACDIISLGVQGAGGGIASSASSDNEDPDTGGNIMLGGIIFQMVTVTLYVILATEFYIRYFKDRPLRAPDLEDKEGNFVNLKQRHPIDKRLKVMTLGLAIYRTIELTDGFNGKIISTEIWFNIFDGAMIVLAMYTLNFIHPGFFWSEKEGKPRLDPVAMNQMRVSLPDRRSNVYEQSSLEVSKVPLIS